MLKFIFMLLSFSGSHLLMAQSSFEKCQSHLSYWFRAMPVEMTQICSKNSQDSFLHCMEKRAQSTAEDVLTAAHTCDPQSTVTSAPIQNPLYLSFRSCSGRLQAGASMRPERAFQVCQRDSSEVMIKCIVGLAQGARFHPEHALQYCQFANENYRNQMSSFVACAGVKARELGGVFEVVQVCHDMILDKIIPQIAPKAPIRVSPRPSESSVVAESHPPQKEQRARTVVPAPVEIKVQESIKPDVVSSRPVVSETPTNAESLPID